MADSHSVGGLDALLGALRKLQQDTLPVVGRALYEEATDVASKADKLVPYDTGNLARSQVVHHPQIAGGQAFVDITYGGVAKSYALKQHETLWYRHPSKASGLPLNGRQAKYLSQPAEEAMAGFNYRMRIRVEAIVRGLV